MKLAYKWVCTDCGKQSVRYKEVSTAAEAAEFQRESKKLQYCAECHERKAHEDHAHARMLEEIEKRNREAAEKNKDFGCVKMDGTESQVLYAEGIRYKFVKYLSARVETGKVKIAGLENAVAIGLEYSEQYIAIAERYRKAMEELTAVLWNATRITDAEFWIDFKHSVNYKDSTSMEKAFTMVKSQKVA